MSTLQIIAEQQTSIRIAGRGYHESIFRSWLILGYVQRLLEMDAPPAVVLKVLKDLRELPNVETDVDEEIKV